MNYTPEMYRQKLEEVFERHDPGHKYLSEKIVERFPNRQKEVFEHLTAVYAKREGNLDKILNEDSIMSIPPSPHTGVG
ncbi:MAG TPA: hypothetical protein VKY37_10065 [Brumimicrobium sp.]|nr:hypothetical protein [Brumimicrobium sp.]